MQVKPKFVALLAFVCALTVTQLAIAAGGLKVVTTPAHPKKGQMVQMKVSGLKPNERVSATLKIPSSGQTNHYTAKAGSAGVLINAVRAQVKGRNVWTYTGKSSHKTISTSYVVR
jgi:hypothetical protein